MFELLSIILQIFFFIRSIPLSKAECVNSIIKNITKAQLNDNNNKRPMMLLNVVFIGFNPNPKLRARLSSVQLSSAHSLFHLMFYYVRRVEFLWLFNEVAFFCRRSLFSWYFVPSNASLSLHV